MSGRQLSIVPASPVSAIIAAEKRTQDLIRAELERVLGLFEAAADDAAALAEPKTLHAGTKDALRRLAATTATQIETIRQIAGRQAP